MKVFTKVVEMNSFSRAADALPTSLPERQQHVLSQSVK
ncbi:LysR family transcriptional regulator [Paraburkholderia panacisoli]|jgi:hypothetical protein|uniref:LysR family transcriptional regulator n=1 Tax=Paraburkholderia panacisoli TaxID=2603818 RepID=A0A5B0HC81_9BURK|nr:LysR family transcriptional regulator [Paraburkholderia panacisoli]KAA1012875.1 LysR family transcriptional regulator [Paraburkholderia panacisoli]